MKKLLHLYWGCNQPMSYLRYLTAISFRKLNPDWEINIWYPSIHSKSFTWGTNEQPLLYRGYDYFQELEKNGFTLKAINFQRDLDIPSDIPEVHKSDLLRWWLLGEYGGVWSDFDILYVRSITDAHRKEWKGAGICKYLATANQRKKYHAIGFLISEGDEGKEFFNAIFKLGVQLIPQIEYQAFGVPILENYLNTKKIVPFYFDPRYVYHFNRAYNIPYYFKSIEINFDVHIGFHWYGGNPDASKFEAIITKDNIHSLAETQFLCKEAIKICATAF